MIKTKVFQLKEILPNPFRRMDKYPINRSKVEELKESVKSTGFWEDMTVRINDEGRPEIPAGHHRLTALKEMYPGTKEFEWQVRPMSDAMMIQRMARENGESYKTDPSVLRETITSTVIALAAGRITAEEIGISKNTDTKLIRFAPNFTQKGVTSPAAGELPKNAYTVVSLARFLGMSKAEKDEPRNSFVAVFGALELEQEGVLTEAATKGLESRKLGEVVAAVRRQRDAALKEAVRLGEAAERQKQAAARQAEAAKRAAEDAEVRRVEATKRLKEAQERQEKSRLEVAKQKLEAAKKAGEAAEKQRKAAAEAVLIAKKKEGEAQKEDRAATAHIKGVATQLADEAKTLNRDDIRGRGQELAEENARRTGKAAAERRKITSDDEDVEDDFLKGLKGNVCHEPPARLASNKLTDGTVRAIKEIVETGYRALAIKRHPDHGGSTSAMAHLNSAAAWLRNSIRKEGL